MSRRQPLAALATSLAMVLATSTLEAWAYPLDGYEESGIARVEAFRIAQKNKVRGNVVPPGAELKSDEIILSLRNKPYFRIPAPDPVLTSRIRGLLGGAAGAYGIAVLDLSDPDHPRYAEVNADRTMSPGSVGKILVALGIFQEAADIAPDLEKRRQLLKEKMIVADDIIIEDDHEIPIWKPGDKKVTRGPIALGDQGSLYTYLDHMMSVSSNASAAMLMREAVLMEHFGKGYPSLTYAEGQAYLTSASKDRLARELVASIKEPVGRNGLDRSKLSQGSLFTKEGKKQIPGAGSYASARELLEFLVKMEKGQLVDPWSSLEMKKLMYLTDRRIRYAASPVLRDSAIYFKSGSLFKCRPEPGYVCEKYHGNLWNFMNSVAIIEEPHRDPPLRYMAVVMSNVLRRNSAEEHERLGAQIHRIMDELHPEVAKPAPTPKVEADEEEEEDDDGWFF